MNKDLYTEKEVNQIMYKHDEKWFELMKSQQLKFIIIICFLCTIIGLMIGVWLVGYYTTPPVKTIQITDYKGNCIETNN